MAFFHFRFVGFSRQRFGWPVMRLIGISGKRGTGKSLLGKILSEQFGFVPLSFAKELKERVRGDFGLREIETDGGAKEKVLPEYGLSPREIMIKYGQFFRSIDPDYWVRRTLRHVKREGDYCITDVRFRNEADAITKLGGVVVRLERLPELNVYKGTIDDESENALDSYSFSSVLVAEHNKTPEDLLAYALFLCATVK